MFILYIVRVFRRSLLFRALRCVLHASYFPGGRRPHRFHAGSGTGERPWLSTLSSQKTKKACSTAFMQADINLNIYVQHAHINAVLYAFLVF